MEIFITTKSELLDISNLAIENITIKYFLKNTPSVVNLSFLSSIDNISEGDIVSISYDGNNLFYGYIFTIKSQIDSISIIAYDQIRYLIHRDTYIYSNKKASDIIRSICSEAGLSVGSIEDTSYIIPYRIEENQLIMDIIHTALDLSEKFNNKKYILYDDFGKICLSSYDSMKLGIILDCQSHSTEYIFTSSIDKESYNSIKVSVKNQKDQVISTYMEEDSENKKNWGMLRLFKRLPNDYTSAQAQNYAKNLLTIHNKCNEQLQVTFHQFISIRAGNSINLLLKNEVIKSMMAQQVTYTINNNQIITTLLLTNF